MKPSLTPGYFDDVYRRKQDPWDMAASAYEAAKYEHTVSALPQDRYENALEIGCSIGVLTRRLAPRCTHLLSVDVAEAALEQARVRCLDLPEVEFRRIQIPREFPAGPFDLIVVSEVGYYFSREDLGRVQTLIAENLHVGGTLLLVHWTPVVPDYPLTGDEVHESFLQRREFIHRSGERREKYRLDVFERAGL